MVPSPATETAALEAKLRAARAQLRALDRSQGRAEFDLTGEILDVNDNFLDMFGYDRHELIGRHHRILVLPDERDSAEYSEFWNRLRRGLFHRGEFTRVAVDGSKRWIQATYNPVIGPDGVVEKVVKYAVDVTPQILAEQEARLARRILNAQLAAIDRSQARVEFGLDGTILDANENFLRIFGYSADELIGASHQTLVAEQEATDDSYKLFWDRLREGGFHSGEFRRFAKDGSPRWIQATYNPVFRSDGNIDKVVKYAINVTPQIIAEEEAARARRLLNAQLEAIDRSHARIEFDLDTTIIDVNDNFLQMLGYQPEELIGSPHRMLLAPEDAADSAYGDFWEKLREGRFHSGEFRRIAKDGSVRWIHATHNPVMRDDGSIEKIVKYAVDITAAKLMQQRSVDKQRLESIGVLAAGVAHEINTPMQAVVTNLNYVQDLQPLAEAEILRLRGEFDPASSTSDPLKSIGEFAEKSRAAITDTIEASARVIEIVRAMKSVSHHGDCHHGAIDLPEVVHNAVTITRNAWKFVASVDVDIDQAVSPLLGNTTELCQVFTNLIVNAADAIQERFGEDSTLGVISIHAHEESQQVLIDVSDNGAGMTEAVQRRMFEQFYTTKPVGKGSGQGLALTHDIVVGRHGGQIEVQSQPGVGSRFRLVLPTARAALTTGEEADA